MGNFEDFNKYITQLFINTSREIIANFENIEKRKVITMTLQEAMKDCIEGFILESHPDHDYWRTQIRFNNKKGCFEYRVFIKPLNHEGVRNHPWGWEEWQGFEGEITFSTNRSWSRACTEKFTQGDLAISKSTTNTFWVAGYCGNMVLLNRSYRSALKGEPETRAVENSLWGFSEFLEVNSLGLPKEEAFS